MKKHILVIDDDQRVLDSLRRTLHDQSADWSVTYVRHPETAWEQLLDTAYDAIVTDVRMPGINGFDLLTRIRQTEKTKDVPVVVLTGLQDRHLKEKALDLGAIDLMNKPIDSSQLIARLKSVLQFKKHEDELRSQNDMLTEQVTQQNIDLAQIRMSIVCRLGMAAEYRDETTGNHVIRVGSYSRAVAAAMGLPKDFLEMLALAAPLHDIGKIGIPDSVLLKPGPLTPDEWVIMQRHCEIGYHILSDQSKAVIPLFDWYSVDPNLMRGITENNDPLLEMAASIALTHHEKWDGSGYPQGLAGEAIPLPSRIVAIADVFDAITSDRPYGMARMEEEALAIIRAGVGKHFDPHVHEAFMKALPEIRDIAAKFNDQEPLFTPSEETLA